MHLRIPEYLAAVARGDFDAAYKINLQDNVFSGVLGRVCGGPCEAACRGLRLGVAGPVAGHFLSRDSKRAAADFSSEPCHLAPAVRPADREAGGGDRRRSGRA